MSSKRQLASRTRKALSPFLPAKNPQHDHLKGQPRPSWRGRQHALAALVSIPAGAVAVAVAPPGKRWPMAVYAACLSTTLTVSAAYHTMTESKKAQQVGSKVDRATIYTLIAGTITPVVMYSQPKAPALTLSSVWAAAALGAAARATGQFNRAGEVGYLGLGWAGALAAKRAWAQSRTSVVLLAAGGVAYTVGAGVYASGWPNGRPESYGHHEVFHTLTLVGMSSHYAALLLLALAARRDQAASLALAAS